MLDKKQRQVVEAKSHCLAVAGPGSGKTRVLVYKAEHILREDHDARILITTFTQDAATEIRRRILDKLKKMPGAAKRVASGTFHSIALSQLKMSAGFDGTIIGAGQMRQYVERALVESRVKMDMDNAIVAIEDAKINPNYEPSNDDIGKLFTAYDRLTKRNNVIDFTDMLSRTVRMMKQEELPPKECQHLFVDEQQDIDELQYAWCVEHIKKGAIFTGIGDDDQSIYKFRRALGYEGMMRINRDYDAEIITLDTNYRSNVEIVSSAIKLIEKNTNRINKRIISERGTGGSITAIHAGSDEEEASLVGKEIIKSMKEVEHNGEITYQIEKDEWAVLARNNRNMRIISLEFDALGIPYTGTIDSLWGKPPICYAVALLSSLITGQKAGFDSALSYTGIDEEVLDKLHEKYGDDFGKMFTEDADFSNFSAGTRATMENFSNNCKSWLKELRKHHSKNDRTNNAISGVFEWFVEYLETNREDKKGGLDRDVKFLRTAKGIMNKMNGPLQKRLQRLSKKNPGKDQKNNTATGTVFLGTLHSSKGLEFNNVWLISIDKGIIPSEKEWTEETNEEERRLFYVGMTRAKNRLFISCTAEPSHFIEEAGLKLEYSTETGKVITSNASDIKETAEV